MSRIRAGHHSIIPTFHDSIRTRRGNPKWRTAAIKISMRLVAIILVTLPGTYLEAGFEQKNPAFSLTVKNETLERVIARLAEASDYEIKLNDDWKDEPLSIEMQNVTLEEALRRCLKDFNHVVVWNQAERQASVMVLGRIGPKGAASGKGERTIKVDRLPGAANSRGRAGDLQSSPTPRAGDLRSSPRPEVSISGGDTDFVQGTRTAID